MTTDHTPRTKNARHIKVHHYTTFTPAVQGVIGVPSEVKMNRLNLEYPNRIERNKIVRDCTVLFAVKHMLHVSPLREDIAAAVGIGVARLERLTQQKAWGDAVDFWTGGETRDWLPKDEIDLTLTGDMRRAEGLWQDMFDKMPVKDLQKFEHRGLQEGYPTVVWDVDDLRLAKRLHRCFHRGVAIGFQVLVLISAIYV